MSITGPSDHKPYISSAQTVNVPSIARNRALDVFEPAQSLPEDIKDTDCTTENDKKAAHPLLDNLKTILSLYCPEHLQESIISASYQIIPSKQANDIETRTEKHEFKHLTHQIFERNLLPAHIAALPILDCLSSIQQENNDI